jgi:hypothetical protein
MSESTRPTPREYAARRHAERRRQGGILAVALLASVALHFALFRTVSFTVPVQPASTIVPPPRAVDIAPVMQAYDLVEVAVDVPPIEVQIRERQVLRETDRPALEAPAAELPGVRPPTERIPSASVRERLQYRMGTAQDVWRPPPPAAPGELSREERVEARVAARLDEIADSVAAEEAARARALDWTREDADGRRWGVSPGQIHLGDITLPMPFSFAPAPGRREEIAGRIQTWNEIQYQAAQTEGREIIQDRARAMRERIDRERRARMSADSAAAPPDTTRARTGSGGGAGDNPGGGSPGGADD